jgi:aminoglycoside 6'-N-acetyltransferase I
VAFDWTVRQLQPGDKLIGDYRDLRVALWPDCNEDCDREIASMLGNPERWAVFVVSLNIEKAVGFVEVGLREYAEGANSAPVAYLEGWFVAYEHRRGGVGKALVKAAENWAILRGCREIGIAAHQRLGYKEVERQVCFLKQLEPLP